ncbi:MAG: beta-lactamase family protein [Ruminococcaceae bacterium]|nr:beta-lactamase family protein [Oscillospiraceae bacterium]
MLFDRLIDFLDYYLPMLGVPGSDTVIYRNHEEIFRHQSGFDSLRDRISIKSDLIYNLYSCTKVSTAVAALQLIERGEMLLTDAVQTYLPEYKNIKVKKILDDGTVAVVPAKNTMLIKHLFSMTSGLDYDLQRPAIERIKRETAGRCPTLDVIRALPDDPLLFEPGERYCYGLSHDVLGGIVELLSGMPLGEYMRKNIFEPLGMTDTGFRLSENSCNRVATQYMYDPIDRSPIEIPSVENRYRLGTEYESAGAGLYSTVDDYILLVDALANGGVGKNGARILSEATVKLMSKTLLNKEQNEYYQTKDKPGYSYGYGVRIVTDPELSGSLIPEGTFGWDGARGSFTFSDPKNKIAVFHAEHMGGVNNILIPRLMNVIYSCIED